MSTQKKSSSRLRECMCLYRKRFSSRRTQLSLRHWSVRVRSVFLSLVEHKTLSDSSLSLSLSVVRIHPRHPVDYRYCAQELPHINHLYKPSFFSLTILVNMVKTSRKIVLPSLLALSFTSAMQGCLKSFWEDKIRGLAPEEVRQVTDLPSSLSDSPSTDSSWLGCPGTFPWR